MSVARGGRLLRAGWRSLRSGAVRRAACRSPMMSTWSLRLAWPATISRRSGRTQPRALPTPVRWLVVAAEPVTSIDVTAADALCELDDQLRAAGITMCFAEVKHPVKEKLQRFGLLTRFGERPFFDTIEEAVSAFRAAPASITPVSSASV